MSKRILSLVLALVMVLGTFGTVFAAETAAVTVEKDAAEFLAEAKILKGDDKGNLNLDLKLERRDMVILLSRLMGDEEVASKFPQSEESPTWEDARTDAYYVPFFAWAQVNKFFAGKTVKEFGPREAITAQDYAVVLLRALGYDVEGHDAWKAALADAKKLGILANVEVEDATEITRGQMSVMTLNALAVNVKDSTKTLAEELGIKLPVPAVLEVKEVAAENLKEIKVVFNKDVDRDNVEDRDVYTTNAGTIKDAQLVEDNTVILTLEGEMKNKKEYKLNIRGIKDGDSAVNTEFKFTVLDNAIPEVAEVMGMGTKAIKVVMSEPVKNVKSSSFAIDGKTYYGSVSATGREIVLRPYGSGFSIGEHKLVVKSLEDYAGFKSVEREVTFEIVEDKDAPEVSEIKGTLERLVVTFNEPVDDSTVSRDSLYWGGVKSQKAKNVVRLSANRYAFEFDKDKSLPTYETKVTVKGVKDYSGNEMKEQDILFKAEIDQTRPEILEVKVEDEKKIEIRFNKPVFEDDAVKTGNYTLTNEDGKSVSFRRPSLSADGRVVTIDLYAALAVNKNYTLKITSIRDNTKLMNTMLPYEEKITAGNYTSPKVVEGGVTGINKERTIYIPFSKKMDLESVADASNYLIVVGKTNYSLAAINGDVDVIQDGKAVVLTLPEKINKKEVGVEKGLLFGATEGIPSVIVLGVKDTAGNYLSNQGVPHDINEDKLVVSSIIATDKETIEVKFKQTVLDATRSGFTAPVRIEGLTVDGNKVIIKLDGKLSASDIGNLKIAKDAVESITGQKLEDEVNEPIEDEISPSLDKVSAVYYNEEKVVITLEFDERLTSGYGNLAMGDLVIKTSNGKTVKNVEGKVSSEVSGKDVIVTITNEDYIKDVEAYDIEITKPSAIRDAKENLVNKTDKIWTAELDKEAEVPTPPLTAAEKAEAQEVVDEINEFPGLSFINDGNLEEVRTAAVEARVAFNALAKEEQKALVTNIKKLEAVENKIVQLDAAAKAAAEAAATEAVEKAEESKTQEDVEAAQALVTKLADGAVKTDLQARITAIVVTP